MLKWVKNLKIKTNVVKLVKLKMYDKSKTIVK